MVVIGASAGGIEALSTLVASLPVPFPAPIVVAQHLDPNHPSHLEEILGRRTSMAVRTVAEPTPMEPGVIYLVPSDHHVSISDHEVSIELAGDKGPKPSVDLLLSSAARAYGEGCVAVILTGSGSDGTAGAQAVKKAGGMVVIQDPATASFPSMPRSLPLSSVDVVSTIDQMAAVLERIVNSVPMTSDDDVTAMGLLLDKLKTTDGIDFATYKRPTIQRRLRGRMAATSQASVRQYARLIDSDPQEHKRLVSSFLIKVTTFFRDRNVMAYIRDTVLPDLVAHARTTGELRLWSAGCATGEEAYSLAIMVADVLGPDLGTIDVRIFATDVDDDALAFARRGVYAPAAIADVSADQRAAYFQEVGGEFEVSKQIRSMVVFGQHDLGVRAPFPRMDMVLCRNVLIYFTREMQERALSVFAYSLREGGRLILGSSESVAPLADEFSVEDQRLKVFRNHGGGHVLGPFTAARRRPVAPPAETPLARAMTSTRVHRDRRMASEERADQVISSLPVGVVVVDSKYATLRINSAARKILEIHGPALDEDFIHLTDSLPATELRAAIRAALAGRDSTTILRLAGADLLAEVVRYVRLTALPHHGSSAGGVDNALLVVMDVTREETDRQALVALTLRIEESHRQRQRLVEANQDMAAANDQLRIANEDFLFNAEEAQSSREEMETLAEELQASNEELETLNEELQSTNEELETANDDLAAQSNDLAVQTAELIEQRADLARGRDRLAAVVDSMGDALLVVDKAGRTVITNPAYDEMFKDLEIIPEDAEGKPLAAKAWPRERARAGIEFAMEFTIHEEGGKHGDRRWFEAHGRPLQLHDDEWAGVVVIREITDRSLRRLEEEFLATASHEIRTPLAALHGYGQLLVRRLAADDEGDARAREYAASVLQQTRNLSHLADRLFDISSIAAGRFVLDRQVIDLGALAHRVVELASVLRSSDALTVRTPATTVWVDADPGRIEQVVLSLLTNSIVHGGGARIEVTVRGMRDHAELTVTDDGRGIPTADQAQLFDRFARVGEGRRTSRAGLGLGLHLAREIVTAHGGTIKLTSIEDQGTRVTVRLPRTGRPERS